MGLIMTKDKKNSESEKQDLLKLATSDWQSMLVSALALKYIAKKALGKKKQSEPDSRS
jgi:hypothetical protein